jgi:hypothetical protein
MLRISTRGMPEEFLFELMHSFDLIIQDEIEYDFENVSKQQSDIHFEFNYEKNRGALPGKINVLILWEPRSFMPWQYTHECLSLFQLIVPISPWRANRLGIKHWILHPISINREIELSAKRDKTVVMINGAKFSANQNSLYGFRRKISKALHKSDINYDLMGVNWKMNKIKEIRERAWSTRKEMQANNRPALKEAFSDVFYNYPEYKGEVADKIYTLSEYKYSLIIENEADYISEKIFDSIFAKTVPIYIGPNLERFDFLSKCVYQCEPNVGKVIEILLKDDPDIYLQKRQFIENLNLEDFEIFTKKYNFEKLAKITRDYLLNSQIHRNV